MFKCQVTGLQSRPGERSFRVPVETRKTMYAPHDDLGRKIFHAGGEGTEIARELVVSAVGRQILEDFPLTWKKEILKPGFIFAYVEKRAKHEPGWALPRSVDEEALGSS